jgi:hypothetical protein
LIGPSQLINEKIKLSIVPKYIFCNLILWAAQIGYKEYNLRQRIWDKMRSYWEHVEEHIGNNKNLKPLSSLERRKL